MIYVSALRQNEYFPITELDGIRYFWRNGTIYETDGKTRLSVPFEELPYPVAVMYRAKMDELKEKDEVADRRLWRSDWM